MVHFEVPRENADALAEALRALESSGLQLVIAQSDGARRRPGCAASTSSWSARTGPASSAG